MLKLFLKLGEKAKPTGEETYSFHRGAGPEPISIFQCKDQRNPGKPGKLNGSTALGDQVLAGNKAHMLTCFRTVLGGLLTCKQNFNVSRGKEELGERRGEGDPPSSMSGFTVY